jgi:hypothetical protein
MGFVYGISWENPGFSVLSWDFFLGISNQQNPVVSVFVGEKDDITRPRLPNPGIKMCSARLVLE